MHWINADNIVIVDMKFILTFHQVKFEQFKWCLFLMNQYNSFISL